MNKKLVNLLLLQNCLIIFAKLEYSHEQTNSLISSERKIFLKLQYTRACAL